MPIYEYICNDCGGRFERLVRNGAEAITCPRCQSTRHTLQLSVFNAAKSSNGASASAKPATGCACTPSTCGCR